jgi:phosphoglycolate phosphatase
MTSMSRNARQLICIDLDGPILDVSERYYQVYRNTITSIGKDPLSKESYWNSKRNKISEAEILAESGTRDPTLVTKYLDTRARRIESSEYLLFDQVWAGTHDTLKVLRSHAELALVTMRTSKGLLEQQLERVKLPEAFDSVLTAGPGLVANERSERKAQLVRDCYGNEEVAGWFVGDTETDILSGRLLGLHTAAITFGIRNVEHLKAVSPDEMLHSPAEFQSWARDFIDSADVGAGN